MGSSEKRGEITAFLSLIFLLMMSLVGAVIDSTSIQLLKNQKRADMSLAMENVFAEYHKEILENYDVFALDVSYGKDCFEMDLVTRRLIHYGMNNVQIDVEKFELLTDYGGKVFYEQAIRYVENKYGMEGIAYGETDLANWQEQIRKSENYQKEEGTVNGQLEDMLDETEQTLPKENNPLQSIETIKKQGLLQLVVAEPETISNRAIQVEPLPSHRQLNKGIGSFAAQKKHKETIGKVFFGKYLLEHYSDMTSAKDTEKQELLYELEYLLFGKASDAENLEAVVKKILALRVMANYTYLLTDTAKKAEAKTVAVGLCALITLPAITEVVTQAILLSWAYGEGIMDMRELVGGKKVPLVKTAENWQLQLSNLANIGKVNQENSGATQEQGMSYRDYVTGLILLESEETLSMRALDLIERNLGLRVDRCITKLAVKSKCKFRRGIQYEFSTCFGYQ